MVTSLYGKVSTETHVLGSTEIESPEPTDADVEKQTERVHYVLEEPSNYQHVTIFFDYQSTMLPEALRFRIYICIGILC